MIDHEQTLRQRVQLGPEQVAQVAKWAEMPTEPVAAMLAAVVTSYIASRIAEVARTFPPPREAIAATDPWADWRTDDGWDTADYDDLLGRGRGQPRNEALIEVYDILAAWWDELPPPVGGHRRNRWRPQFDKIEGQTVPANETATIFAYVARCLDPTNTTRNCNAVASFVKDRARSPASKAKRREGRAAYARQRRNKPPSA